MLPVRKRAARLVVAIFASALAIFFYIPHQNDPSWMLVVVAWAALAAEMFKSSEVL